MSQARRLLGALVGTGAAAVFALIACGGSSEGTVVAKTHPVYDYACQAGGTVTGPVAVPVWGCAPCPSAGGWSSATATATQLSPA